MLEGHLFVPQTLTLREALLSLASPEVRSTFEAIEPELDGPEIWVIGSPPTPRQLKVSEYRRLRDQLQESLLKQLKHGEWESTGFDSRRPLNEPPVEIPRDAWEFLELDFQNSQAKGNGFTIDGIRVRRIDGSERSVVKAEKRCEVWLREQAVAGRTVVKKRELMAEAQERFPDLSVRGFLRAWTTAAPEHWKSPGRKKS